MSASSVPMTPSSGPLAGISSWRTDVPGVECEISVGNVLELGNKIESGFLTTQSHGLKSCGRLMCLHTESGIFLRDHCRWWLWKIKLRKETSGAGDENLVDRF